MRPKIAEMVPQEDWEILTKICAIREGLPDEMVTGGFILGMRMPRSIVKSTWIPSCHMFTHALAKFLPVHVHDGRLTEVRHDGKEHRHEHSWLTRKGSDGRIIIDPWPLGTVTGPAIFIQDYGFHFGNECCILEHRSKEFMFHVAALRLEIRKVMERRRIPTYRAAA